MIKAEKPNISHIIRETLEKIRFHGRSIVSGCDLVEEDMKNYSPNDVVRVCPVCNGRMLDITDLITASHALDEIGFYFQDLTKEVRGILNYYDHPIPLRKVWECQKCEAANCNPQLEPRQSWVRGEGSNNTFAKILFNHNTHVDEVTYDNNPDDRRTYWRIRIGQEWFRFHGMKDDVLESIGIFT